MGFVMLDEHFALVRDLRGGRAGRLAMVVASLAAAGLMACPMFLVVAVIDQNRTIDDDFIALAVGGSISVWLAFVAWLWTRGSAGRLRGRIALGVVSVLIVWALAIPVCVLIEDQLRGLSDFLIPSVLAFALALSAWLALVQTRSAFRPRSPEAAGYDVACPVCGYRLVGLSECRCPECGAVFTLEEVVLAERGKTGAEPEPDEPPSVDPERLLDGSGVVVSRSP